MIRLFALLFPLAFAAGCATQSQVALNYVQDHDFSGYQTFAWMGDEPVVVEGALLLPTSTLRALEAAVREELLAKGFTEAQDPSEADFGVSIVLGLNESLEFESTDRTIYGPSEVSVTGVDRVGRLPDTVVVSRSGRTAYELDPLVSARSEGTLSIGIFERDSGRLLWMASGQRDITNSVPDGRNADLIAEMMLEDFPPNQD